MPEGLLGDAKALQIIRGKESPNKIKKRYSFLIRLAKSDIDTATAIDVISAIYNIDSIECKKQITAWYKTSNLPKFPASKVVRLYIQSLANEELRDLKKWKKIGGGVVPGSPEWEK